MKWIEASLSHLHWIGLAERSPLLKILKIQTHMFVRDIFVCYHSEPKKKSWFKSPPKWTESNTVPSTPVCWCFWQAARRSGGGRRCRFRPSEILSLTLLTVESMFMHLFDCFVHGEVCITPEPLTIYIYVQLAGVDIVVSNFQRHSKFPSRVFLIQDDGTHDIDTSYNERYFDPI